MFDVKDVKEYAKKLFKQEVGKDSDYLIIAEHGLTGLSWSVIPSKMGTWQTKEEAIKWFFDMDATIIRVYDLYAETVEQALVESHSAIV